MSVLKPSTSSLHRDGSSSSRLPQRISTDPTNHHTADILRRHVKKRIIVCCDGTWQDGLSSHYTKYTNVLRLARAVSYEDQRKDARGPCDISDGIVTDKSPIQQIIFYQSGIGTEDNIWSEYVDGATGASLAEKVEEAYGFIAHNYCPGDELFLFGFSRGAYTARMVAMLIGEIGVLDRATMNDFATIFMNFQERGVSKDKQAQEAVEQKLAPWLNASAIGRQRVDIDGDGFTIKCLGVWDTVGALGLPDLLAKNPKNQLFGLKDPGILGSHIQYTFQALAIDEKRKDFKCNVFTQTEKGLQKGQILKQCWFEGCHTDIGGGYETHDLADITLFWMAANIESMLALDLKYLESFMKPVAKWGKQKAHDSYKGIFLLAPTVVRTLPREENEKTREQIHPSVDVSLYPELQTAIEKNGKLLWKLLPLEEQFQRLWDNCYDPEASFVKEYEEKMLKDVKKKNADSGVGSIASRFNQLFKRTSIRKNTSSKTERRRSIYEQTAVDVAATKTGLPVTEKRLPSLKRPHIL